MPPGLAGSDGFGGAGINPRPAGVGERGHDRPPRATHHPNFPQVSGVGNPSPASNTYIHLATMKAKTTMSAVAPITFKVIALSAL